MKRAVSILLALLMAVFTVACGGSKPMSATEVKASEPEKTEASATPKPTMEPTPEPTPEPVSLRAGETVKLDFMEFTLNTAEAMKELPVLSERSSVGSYLNTADGEKYVCIHGTAKNLSQSEINLKNITATLMINKSSYTASINGYHKNSFNTAIAPLEEVMLYVFVRVPADIAESVETCSATIMFNESLQSRSEKAEDNPYQYTILFSTENGAENVFTVNKFEPKQLSLGETIKTDFVEFQLNELSVKDGLKERYKGTTYSYATDKSLKVICLIGTIQNTSKSDFNPCFTGKMVVDGYEYEIKDWELCKGLKVAPLVECPLYIFAEVPESLAKNFKTLTLTFGFDDGFSNKFYSDIEMLPYAYTLTVQSGQ